MKRLLWRFGTVVLAVGMAGVAHADLVSIGLSGLTNSDLTGYTGGGNYPLFGGSVTVDGIPFTLATGSNSHTSVIQSSTTFGVPQTYTLAAGQFGVALVYTLINSAFGSCGTSVGDLVFVGSSSSYTYPLTEGANVRDHFEGGFCNTVTDVAGTANFALDRLDMQAIVLPASFASQTLESIEFQSSGQGLGGSLFLAAVTLDPGADPGPNAVPEPAMWPVALVAMAALPLARRLRHL